MPYIIYNKRLERHDIMNIGMWILVIFMCVVGLGSTFYIVGSMFWVLGWKICRKIKYGTPLND